MNKRPFKNFRGSIDELLEQANNIDVEALEDDLAGITNTILTDEEALDCIMEEYHCDEQTARDIMWELKLEEANIALKNLESLGLVRITTYDEYGNPDKYELTEKGKQYAQALQDNDNKKNMDSGSQTP